MDVQLETIGTRKHPFKPTAEYEEWREEAPVKRVRLASGQETWLVLRRQEAADILDMTDHTGVATRLPGYPNFRPGEPMGDGETMLQAMDPPNHTKYRKILAPFFSAKRVASWKPELENIVNTTIDDLLAHGSPADFYTQFSLVVPSKAICMLLGVDYEHHEAFERLTRPIAGSSSPAKERDAAQAELYGLVVQMFEEQRSAPGGGVVAKLIKLIDAGEIPYDIAVANTLLLIVGGHETTAHTISMGTVQMLQRPELIERITKEPGKLPALVNEMVRTQSITDLVMGRAVTKDITVGDTVIPAGAGLAIVVSSVNHDPGAFRNPHEIDLDREDSDEPGMLGFGGGIHSCIGQSLARAEMIQVFSTLFQRIPTLRLTDEPVEYRHDQWIFGMDRMPVEW